MKISTTSALHRAVQGVGTGVDLRLLEQLFDHTPDLAFFVKDDRGCYVAVNHSMVERHGLKGKRDMIGRRPSDVCPGDFGRIPAEQDAYVLRTGRAIIERLALQWYSPHKPVWCLTTKLPIINSAGVVAGILGISQDVRAPIRPKDIPTDLAKALHRLETGYGDALTSADLAKVAKLPVPRFARLVKRIFGITPVQLIAKTRIAAASRMLRESSRSIAEIAQDCGYYDHSAFTRSFRAVTSVTPTQFRAEGTPDRRGPVSG